MKLVDKYNKPGPRYTSYPAVPFWTGAPTESLWFDHIKTNLDNNGIDLYIHIPFCEKLCWYCGCNRLITKDQKRAENYVDYLIKEWKIYQTNITNLKISSIHFGGGTPNFLSPDLLNRLLAYLEPDFNDDFLGSIEVDPRTLQKEHLEVVAKFRFSRISMGIQDFSEEVQSNINRIQSFELVEKCCLWAKELNINSINFDLIYGLPAQKIESITNTFEQVLMLNPDMIAYYSYAHLPNSLKNQKLINEDLLPSGDEKKLLFEAGKDILLKNNYVTIGFDHFAKKDNYLGLASLNKKVKRNFMGYTDKKSNVMLALGVSGISNTPMSFTQNEKEIPAYFEMIDSQKLPLSHGHVLSEDDQIIAPLLQDLLCNGIILKEKITKLTNSKIINDELGEMSGDGLLVDLGEVLEATESGRLFLRNIAMTFDHHLREKKQIQSRFSQTV